MAIATKKFSMWGLIMACTLALATSFAPFGGARTLSTRHVPAQPLNMMDDDDYPSDYDTEDLAEDEKTVAVDTEEEDIVIRDALKRELLLLSSVTNRGEYASAEERDIMIDLVTQLEALNPTADPASYCEGEWDLCLSSTQFFRSSPFFLSIGAALSDNKEIANNFFDLHDRATTASRIGRVRQNIGDGSLVSEVELEVGMLPGIPLRVKGTVITTSSLKVVAPETWETQIKTTQVKGSNIPLLNQFLDEPQFELPVGDAFNTVMQKVPTVTLKTFYVDEGLRITRDVDDNFYVFSRA